MPYFVSDMAYLPRILVTRRRHSLLKDRLVFTQYVKDLVRSTDEFKNAFGNTQAEKQEIVAYRISDDRRYIAVPRRWAMDIIGEDRFDDRTVFPKMPNRPQKVIPPRDERQAKFFRETVEAAKRPGPQGLLINGSTGVGKTATAIHMGYSLDTPTLLVVDSNKIAEGFLKNFRKFFGNAWTRRNVGRIQQDECSYRGKPYSIAMVQSLVSRRYPKEMYNYFGLVCYDEVQIYGAEHYHSALGMFSARVVAGFTATNKKGSFGKVIKTYLGKPAVISRQEVMKPVAYVIRNSLKSPLNIYSDGTLLSDIAKQRSRNNLITEIVYSRGFQRNRICLVMSERISQLQEIRKMLMKKGVPEKEIGLHVGEYLNGTYAVSYSYDNDRFIKMKHEEDYYTADEIANELTTSAAEKSFPQKYAGLLPEALKAKIKKGARVYFSVLENTTVPTQDELEHMASTCSILLATKQIFAKGVDYPRIDMGVEATPIGDVTQPLGRILRIPDGFEKPMPEWYSILDSYNPVIRNGGFPDSRQENVSKVMNAYFDSKHELRILGFKKAGASVVTQDREHYVDD